jgi:integrase
MALGRSVPDDALVVVNEIGEPVRPKWFSDRFRALSVEAGVPKIRLHATRHTLGQLMGAAGVAPADGARILGHSTEVYLSTYSKSTPAGVLAAAEQVAVMLHGS